MDTAGLSHEHVQEEMQKEVARKFEQLKDATWHSVDASMSVEAVAAEVQQIADAAMRSCEQGRPVQYLWL